MHQVIYVYGGEKRLLNGSIKLWIDLVSLYVYHTSYVRLFIFLHQQNVHGYTHINHTLSLFHFLGVDLDREIVGISTFYLDRYLSMNYVEEEVR